MFCVFQLEARRSRECGQNRHEGEGDVDARHNLFHAALGGALQRGVPLAPRPPVQRGHHGSQTLQGRTGLCHGCMVLPL